MKSLNRGKQMKYSALHWLIPWRHTPFIQFFRYIDAFFTQHSYTIGRYSQYRQKNEKEAYVRILLYKVMTWHQFTANMFTLRGNTHSYKICFKGLVALQQRLPQWFLEYICVSVYSAMRVSAIPKGITASYLHYRNSIIITNDMCYACDLNQPATKCHGPILAVSVSQVGRRE